MPTTATVPLQKLMNLAAGNFVLLALQRCVDSFDCPSQRHLTIFFSSYRTSRMRVPMNHSPPFSHCSILQEFEVFFGGYLHPLNKPAATDNRSRASGAAAVTTFIVLFSIVNTTMLFAVSICKPEVLFKSPQPWKLMVHLFCLPRRNKGRFSQD